MSNPHVAASVQPKTQHSAEGGIMAAALARIESALSRMAQLADQLRADPDGHVRRSVEELRDAFVTRGAIEPAVARVRRSMEMLRSGNHEESRREFQRRSVGLDQLDHIMTREVVPGLRRLGFEV